MPAFVDKLTIENVDLDATFDLFTSFGATLDMSSPSVAGFELGEELTFPDIERFITFGTTYACYLNDRPLLRGRLEARDVADDAGSGTATRFNVRTKLADAWFATAKVDIKFKNASVKDFILALYKPLGYAESDFIFDADVARSILTGKRKGGGEVPPDFEALNEYSLKVQPPETVFQCADKHLRRFGLMHWDGPDGRIVVGKPEDDRDPTYWFQVASGSLGQQNNCTSVQLLQTIENVPSSVTVTGTGWKIVDDETVAKKYVGQAFQGLVRDAGLHRPMLVQAGSLKNQAQADAAARRELASRIRDMGSITVQAEDLSYRDGTERVNYGVNIVADVTSDRVGVASGSYLIQALELSRSAADGDSTTLQMVQRGLWVL